MQDSEQTQQSAEPSEQCKEPEQQNKKLIRNLSEEQCDEMKKAFDLFDKDNDGHITAEELDSVLRSMNMKLTDAELKEMIREVDDNENGTIEFNEFVTMMDKNMGLKTTEKELKEAFACFDKDGNGFITAEELREAMQKMGDKYSKEDIEEMIKGVDIDCDGQVSYEEFVKMMTGK